MKIIFLYFSVIVFIISWWLITPNLLNPKEDILDESATRNNIEISPTTLSKHNELSKNFRDNAIASTTPNASTLVSESTSQPKSNKPLDSFFLAWDSRNNEQLMLAEDSLVEKLKHGNRQDIGEITATLLNAEGELRYRLLNILSRVGNEASFEILGDMAQNENPELRKAALKAIGNTQVSLSSNVTNSLKNQLNQAINQKDSSLVLALGQALANGASAETAAQLIAITDDPAIDEPTNTALMQALENAKSSKLVPYINQYLADDPTLTTNAAITTGNVLANIQDISSANAVIKWAEKADFDKVGDQARYWFNQLAQNSEIKSELRSVNQFHEFDDPRMGDLIYQIGINQSR